MVIPDGGSGCAPHAHQAAMGYTDPDCRLYKKDEGQQAKLCYLGHLMMENRNGFVVEGQVTPASSSAEREAAAEMVEVAWRMQKDPGGGQGV